jgi:3-oxoacyl-(acyl-carrier-protein) synthase
MFKGARVTAVRLAQMAPCIPKYLFSSTPMILPNRPHLADEQVVVVTGVGAVSALGLGATSHFDSLVEGRTGLAVQHHLDVFDIPIVDSPSKGTSSAKSQVAKFVGGHINPTAIMEALGLEDIEKMGRHDLYARWAMEEALKRSLWSPTGTSDKSKTGAVVSSAFHNAHEVRGRSIETEVT